ncbi:MAG: hypothetical protein KKD99_12865 [Proteobacteria bacterium]|nr:hypothetical protein [Pseudomonadota bacterium]MBU4354875.1 hypothetical protein [Pseudomonadota bacterium]MBU4449470.1 hypothetical protein [Pseudomonadota bacterium]MCG2773699.1 hypothetical protein [Desulfobacterales bacterium]
MSWRRELKPVNLLLLAGVAFLLVAIIQIWWGGDMPFQGPAAKGPEMPTAPILRDQQPLSAFKTVAAKNLFSQARSDPTVGVAKVQDSLEGRQLLGTMIIGETKAAIIGGKLPGSGKGKPEIEAVYLGEEWNGFTVLEIANDSVTFHNKDGRKTLKFPE